MEDLIQQGTGLDIVERPVIKAEVGKGPREIGDLVISVLRGHRVLGYDDRDRIANLDLLPLLREHGRQRARVERLHLHVRLVGLDLGDDVAALDLVALLLEPLDDSSLGHGVRELRHGDFSGHDLSLLSLITGPLSLVKSGRQATSDT